MNEMLSIEDVAHLVGCSTRTVYRLIDANALPRPRKISRLVRWPSCEIKAWLDRASHRRAA